MPNHLAAETSPYLLQHVDNPVDWYPWGEEALALAKAQHKPVLLSIGYAACHWCHVMAHESFEHAETAALMNRWFINIKVDREERPDLDSIYMAAVTSMTGHGGWPMTVFLTPEGKPFFSGTYYPLEPRYGMPSFRQVLSGIAAAWEGRQDEVQGSANNISLQLQEGLLAAPAGEAPAGQLHARVLEKALADLASRFDAQRGGFGGAPKFPQPMLLDFLLREHLRSGHEQALDMVRITLQRMARGGIYDHLGGGFARYSTDNDWLAPHFEKMLYDNAQLARVYLRAWQVTGDESFRRVVEQTLDYVVRDMRHEDGGFYSSLDADSEGVEGKFYVWSAAEIRAVLGAEADLFMHVYDVRDAGNWEGANILNLKRSLNEVAAERGETEERLESLLSACRQRLLSVRNARIWPGLDDKVLASWNGLMLSAFAEAGRVLQRADYIAVAERNAEFLLREFRRANGGDQGHGQSCGQSRLWRTWKADTTAKLNAYLEDYACLAEGLLSLYEANFEPRWFTWAQELGQSMLRHFRDPLQPGFYDTSDDHEQLILRPRDVQDNAMPSGNAKAAMVLFRLGLYSGNSEFLQAAQDSVAARADLMGRYPSGFGEWLNVASFMLGEPQELALVGPLPALADLRSVVNERYHPRLVVAAGPGGDHAVVPLLAQRSMVGSRPAAYLCQRMTCQAPVTDATELRRLLSGE
jgi:uncharacterized protein YyaL (SSP411 family)